MAGRGVVAGDPAAAQDANAIVVTAATAARYDLHSVSDLAAVAPRLVFGGPPECPGRAYCLPGLSGPTGCTSRRSSRSTPVARSPCRHSRPGNIGVALLFTTDPAIPARHLVVLADDRGLQPAENITPLLRRDAVARHGPGLMAVLNAVSAHLDVGRPRALDARVELPGQNPRQVAEQLAARTGTDPAGACCTLSEDIGRVIARDWPAGLPPGPAVHRDPPAAPPDRRAAAAAAPDHHHHNSVAGPRGRGPGRRVPGVAVHAVAPG